MGSPLAPGKFSKARKMAIQKLIPGHQFAAKLRIHLQKPQGNCGPNSVQSLADKVVESINEALTVLNGGEPQFGCQNPVSSPVCSPSSEGEKGKCSDKNVQTPVTTKHRRGVYKRRTAESWAQISATPFDDGHVWKKYGQKDILGAKHPRSYFRCTHKLDQGCEAAKQVQKTEDDPSMYLVTYVGRHTCRDQLKVLLDSPPRQPIVLNFQTPFIGTQDLPCSPSFPTIKQEDFEEKPGDTLTHNRISTSDYIMSADLPQFESYSRMMNSSALAPPLDFGNVASGVYWATTSEALDMDSMVHSVELDDIFNFDNWDSCNNML